MKEVVNTTGNRGMRPENKHPVSSYQTILNSVQNDTDTLNWFFYLLWNPDIRNALTATEKYQRDYRSLLRIETIEYLLGALTLGCLLGFMKTRLPLFIGFALLLFSLHAVLFHLKKSRIINLSTAFLQRDLTPDQLSKQTLYHLTEVLGRKYNTASLVDTIYFQENFSRILGVGFFLLFISPLTLASLADAVFALFLALVTARFFISNRWVYRLSRQAGII